VLDILQKVFYRSNPAREAFVEMCEDSYVQKMTFDSYLYKTVVPGGPGCVVSLTRFDQGFTMC
jgi:geranylgeranyl reductase